MRLDPGSNYTMARALAPESKSTGDHNSSMVDHAEASSVSFLIDVSDVGTGPGTVDAKVQYSDDGSTWTDEPDDQAGNDTAISQMNSTGQAQLNVPNPRGRYSRIVVTVGTNAVTLGAMSVLGPLRHVSP